MQASANNSPRKPALALAAIAVVCILLRTVFAHSIGAVLPNFTPIGALALFSGAILWKKKWMFALPIGAMLISDTIKELTAPGTGFYPDMAYVYGSFFAIILLGILVRNNAKPVNILLASLGGSVLFFMVTNFGAWTSSASYSKDFSGLIQSYIEGIPFFKYTLAGDLFYNLVFFGGYYLLTSKSKSAEVQKAS